MDRLIRGLHHVTATVGRAQEDLDFYAGLLGMRLVKKTVNFDNHDVYHFYYGNRRGQPGTIMTTFPYEGMGVRAGTRGAGQVAVTSFSVPSGTLAFWTRRLRERGVEVSVEAAPSGGEGSLRCLDPSGLSIRLVASADDTREPWTTNDVAPEHAVRGLHGVTMVVRDREPSLELLTRVLGFEVVAEDEGRTRVAANGNAPGQFIEVVAAPDAAGAVNGIGTVHHVAMTIADAAEQLRLRSDLIRLGRDVTSVLDRHYFRSIYFREPGGVLFEIATVLPGFTVDEDVAELGRTLKLPPWEEPNRARIEARLPKVEAG